MKKEQNYGNSTWEGLCYTLYLNLAWGYYDSGIKVTEWIISSQAKSLNLKNHKVDLQTFYLKLNYMITLIN